MSTPFLSLGRAWRGEEKLWKVFWLYGIVAGGLLGALQGFLVLSVMLPHVRLVPWYAPYWVYGLACFEAAAGIFYATWWPTSLWRCTFNTEQRAWGYAARAFLVLTSLGVIADVGDFGSGTAQGGALSGDELELAEVNCMNKMGERAKGANMDAQEYLQEHMSEFQKCAESGGKP